MFRYLALIWDDTLAQQRDTVQRLSKGIERVPSWKPAAQLCGLSVFTIGGGADGNGVYPLGRDQGVILGRLFHRCESAGHAAAHARILPEEAKAMLRHNGRSLVTTCWGRYVALLKCEGSQLTVLRDPTGTLPCFTLEHQGVHIVFSWLEDVIALPGIPLPAVAWERLAAHLQMWELGNHQTVLDGVERVLPGEAVHLRPAGKTRELFWDALGFARSTLDEDPAKLAPRLRDTVRYCARSWAEGQERILLRLSGGLDSSILAGCLTREDTAAEVLCVNYHSPGADTDERHYARLAARRAHLNLIECKRDEAFRLDHVLQVALTPSPATYVGRMAASTKDAELSQRHGAPCLFTGAGGDQLFFELRTWWPAADFLCVHGFGRGAWRAAMDAARLAQMSVYRTMAMAIRSRFGLRAEGDVLVWQLALLGGATASTAPRDTYLHPALRRATGLPVGKLNHVRMLLHPLAYYDPYERERAPTVVNPLLSQPLIELCLQLPTYALTRGGHGRALARRAFAADLAPEIAARRSKGSIDQHLKTVLAANLPWARELLFDGELVARGFLDRQKVEVALSGKPNVTSVHVTEIHGLIAVEAWLRRWRAAAQAVPVS
ncbi:asparagine synthase-related protein [Rubrivivax sp. RP6-9]|uniref:asparagine synthase-related protein n=1 Tax=Rubrivivax sp. RP6-9 TaxID=3415750 RepID=UPI003CC5469C